MAMLLRSIKSRIFVSVTAVVVVVAGVIMTLSQRVIERGLADAEERSVRNVLGLVEENVRGRYRSLLKDEVATISGRKQELRDFNQAALTTLGQFADLARIGRLPRALAQAQALQWLARTHPAAGGYMVVFDAAGRHLLPGAQAASGTDIASVKDIKGRGVVAAARDETARYGETYLIFQGAAARRQFGHFVPFAPWGWVVGSVADVGNVEVEVGRQRALIEAELTAMLPGILSGGRGVVFVFDDEGRLVVPPQARDLDDLVTVAVPQLKGMRGESMTLTAANGETFEARATYVKPLRWYIASFASRDAMLGPARALLRNQAMIFLVVLGAGLSFAYFFADRISRPLNRLANYAMKIPEVDFGSGKRLTGGATQLPVERADEVGRLSKAFVFMEETLVANVQSLMAVTAARERIEGELGVARDIQTGLLPKVFPAFPGRPEVDLHSMLESAKEVGGDLYDFFFVDPHHLCFAIGDVSGKGVPAALFMAITMTLIRTASERESDPAKILDKVNYELSRDNPNCFFATLLLGIIDVRTGTIGYAAAGHMPPLVVGKGGVRPLPVVRGPAAGAVEGARYGTSVERLAPGETLILYTDGITEAMDGAGHLYGEGRLRSLLAQLSTVVDAKAMIERVVEDVSRYEQGGQHADDLTIMALRYVGAGKADGVRPDGDKL